MVEVPRKFGSVVWNGQSIRDTLSLIDQANTGAVVFVGDDQRIAGFVTDGDIRRGLIDGAELSDPISTVWTSDPMAVSVLTPITERYRLLKSSKLRHLILLEEDGRFADVQTFNEIEELYEINPKRCPVVVMAGGLGRRLMPLTKDCPKPMLPLRGKPLLEHILGRLVSQGFEDILISVAYLREQIIDYFGDGAGFGVRIRYVVEDSPSGTGGCLRLLPEIEGRNFLLVNGDIITDLDLRSLVSFHDGQKFAATMVVRQVRSRLEYGVVTIDGVNFVRLEEKPEFVHYFNTGIYALNRSVLDVLPNKASFDMPDLFDRLRKMNMACGAYEHRGEWIDVGTGEQLEVARRLLASETQS